ncbi:MAG TPA: hypothetical protein VNF47_23235 [Streptosporangiaceae bacterium]|nr:hypothetical protein [Streptosporangiaceae bacterium]
MCKVNQNLSRPLSPPRPCDVSLRTAVVSLERPLCTAPAGWSCAVTGDHLARWLRAFAQGLITRDELIGAVRGLVVISASQLVERAA